MSDDWREIPPEPEFSEAELEQIREGIVRARERMTAGHEGHAIEYCEAFDCYFCGTCDVWLEAVADCGDPGCAYCTGDRPERPSGVTTQ